MVNRAYGFLQLTMKDHLFPVARLGRHSGVTTQTHLDSYVVFTTSILDVPLKLANIKVFSPLSVLPKWHRRGIGSSFIAHGIRAG
jgi:hypothetical protein